MNYEYKYIIRPALRAIRARSLLIGGLAVAVGVVAPACGNGDHTGGVPDSSSSSGGGGGGSSGSGGSSGGSSDGSGGGTSSGSGGSSGGTTSSGGSSGGKSSSGGSGGGSTSSSGGLPGDGGPTTPATGCTPPANYENLFVTLLGHTQADSDAKVTAAWSQLFNPSGANTIFYNGPGANESYVEDIADNDVRTEGMSYGMMVAVQLNHQTEFDRLWTFVKNHMLQSSGQITWHVSTSGGSVGASGGAPDGDEYFATALIFASKRWGDSSGKFNYSQEATSVLNMIRTQDFNQSAHLVAFFAGSGNTDGSYVLPAFYQVWSCFDTANKPFWDSAVTAARSFFQAAANSNGVIPDQSSFTGQSLGGAGSDALRCVANIMMDHNFFNADPWQTTYASEYGAYRKSSGASSTAMLACDGLLGFGLPASTGKPFVQSLWSATIPTGGYRYYDGALYMLGLLHVSGTFQLYF
jgi:oligosaccharide reducing-end xylanase